MELINNDAVAHTELYTDEVCQVASANVSTDLKTQLVKYQYLSRQRISSVV